MSPHRWRQDLWWWICDRCGASTVSVDKPKERDGRLWFNLAISDPPDWRKSTEFGPDCDMELVKDVMAA